MIRHWNQDKVLTDLKVMDHSVNSEDLTRQPLLESSSREDSKMMPRLKSFLRSPNSHKQFNISAKNQSVNATPNGRKAKVLSEAKSLDSSKPSEITEIVQIQDAVKDVKVALRYMETVLQKKHPEFTIGTTSTVIETINSLSIVIGSVIAKESILTSKQRAAYLSLAALMRHVDKLLVDESRDQFDAVKANALAKEFLSRIQELVSYAETKARKDSVMQLFSTGASKKNGLQLLKKDKRNGKGPNSHAVEKDNGVDDIFSSNSFNNSKTDSNENCNSLENAIFNLTEKSTPKTTDNSKESTPSKFRFKSRKNWFKKALSLDIPVTREIRAESYDSYLSVNDPLNKSSLRIESNESVNHANSDGLVNNKKILDDSSSPFSDKSDAPLSSHLSAVNTDSVPARFRSKSDHTTYNQRNQISSNTEGSHDSEKNKETNNDDELDAKPVTAYIQLMATEYDEADAKAPLSGDDEDSSLVAIALEKHTKSPSTLRRNKVYRSRPDRASLPAKRPSVLAKVSADGTIAEEDEIENTDRISTVFDNVLKDIRKAKPASVVSEDDVLISFDVSSYLHFATLDKTSCPCNIKGGSVNALIVYATNTYKTNKAFLEALIMTYRTFITPSEIIEKLLLRFKKFDQMRVYSVSQQTLALILRILHTGCGELNSGTVFRLAELECNFLETGLLKETVMLREALVQECNRMRKKRNKPLRPPPCAENVQSRSYKIFDFTAQELAEQITLMDFQQFKKIEIPEILRWGKKQSEKLNPNLTAFTEHFNNISYWIRTCILLEERQQDREKIMGTCIKILKCLRRMNNFNSYLAILSALDCASVRRLDWQKQFTTAIEELSSLIDNTMSFKIYRTALAEAKPPCIPYLGLILQDVTFTILGNPDKLPDGSINFQGRWKLYTIVKDIENFQNCPYDINVDVTIADFLRGSVNHLTDESLYQLSLDIKPKER